MGVPKLYRAVWGCCSLLTEDLVIRSILIDLRRIEGSYSQRIESFQTSMSAAGCGKGTI